MRRQRFSILCLPLFTLRFPAGETPSVSGSLREETPSPGSAYLWTQLSGGVATCVREGSIIMTGGGYGGPGISGQTEFMYSNDVWILRKR